MYGATRSRPQHSAVTGPRAIYETVRPSTRLLYFLRGSKPRTRINLQVTWYVPHCCCVPYYCSYRTIVAAQRLINRALPVLVSCSRSGHGYQESDVRQATNTRTLGLGPTPTTPLGSPLIRNILHHYVSRESKRFGNAPRRGRIPLFSVGKLTWRDFSRYNAGVSKCFAFFREIRCCSF